MKAGLMLGVNPNAIREEHDLYCTDPASIRIALPIFKEIGLSNNIWECACGLGHLSKALEKNGYNVYSSDLIDRGYGDTKNFLSCFNKFDGDIITNPPYRYAEEFIQHSMDILDEGHKAVFLLKVQFLQSVDRKSLFETYPPKYVIVHSQRIFCAMNGDFEKYATWSKEKEMWTGGTQSYCWYVFEKGYHGDTVVRWI